MAINRRGRIEAPLHGDFLSNLPVITEWFVEFSLLRHFYEQSLFPVFQFAALLVLKRTGENHNHIHQPPDAKAAAGKYL